VGGMGFFTRLYILGENLMLSTRATMQVETSQQCIVFFLSLSLIVEHQSDTKEEWCSRPLRPCLVVSVKFLK